MNEVIGPGLIYSGDRESWDLRLPQGQVAVRSTVSPDKDTPNEDSALVIPVGIDGLVLAVADGVGGAPGGREASKLAVQILAERLGAGHLTRERLRHAILDAVDAANGAILELGRGAATTVVIGEIYEHSLRSYHVGDSELLAVGQRGRIKQRIVPHSPTGFAVEAGLMDENEAVRHNQRHVIFNVIGAPDMRVEMGAQMDIALRDTVLLASDGLLDNLFVDEIVEVIRMGSLRRAADRLVELAGKRMLATSTSKPSKPDDLTIVLYRRNPPQRQLRRALP
jgi:serine/threonine protein phosphatase PrpC